MPKTAIDKNGQFELSEDKVWLSVNGSVPSPAINSIFTKRRSKNDFGGIIATRPDASHYFRPLLFRYAVH